MKRRATLRWVAASLLAAGAVVTGAALAVRLAHSSRFDIRRVEIQGDARHISRAAVMATLGGRPAGNYFMVRLDPMRRAFEALPWVARVSVRRIWPDRLRVTLAEHRAVGQWSDGRLLSDAGVLFVANPAEAELDGPLVGFAGPTRFAPDAARNYRQFSALLAPLQVRIVAMQVSERASWSLQLTPPLQVELGRDDPPGRLAAKLATIVSAYPVVIARLDGPAARIDARYENGFAAARTR